MHENPPEDDAGGGGGFPGSGGTSTAFLIAISAVPLTARSTVKHAVRRDITQI